MLTLHPNAYVCILGDYNPPFKWLCYRVFFLTASFAQIKFDVLCVYFYPLS